jgi:hypothetical protein
MRIFCLFIFCFCFACQIKEEAELPLPLEKAAAVMLDVHTAENAALTLYGTRKDSFMMMYYDQICAIHQIDSTTLKDLLAIVRNQPVISRDLYQEARRQFDAQYPDNR